MTNLQENDADSIHHQKADGTTFLCGDTCESAPDGTHPHNYSVGKKVNDMHASKPNGVWEA